MKVYDGKNLKFQDKLAEKRRRVHALKTLFFIGLSVAIVGFILYLLFFSGLLEIKEVSVNGLDKVNGERFNSKLNDRLEKRWLGLLEYQKNVIFFSSDAFRAEALTAFPEIKEISVNKKLPHALSIDVRERTTAGIWCFAPQLRIDFSAEIAKRSQSLSEGFVEDCKYFDEDGVTWSGAAMSSGYLILVIEDMRQDASKIDRELLSNIMFISKQLKEDNIFINKFTIPGEFIGDFSTFTSGGYELLFSMDSDIEKQLEVLEIFLADKKDDPEFKPQYIDLRINGRVYYK